MKQIEITGEEFMADLPGRFEEIRRGAVFIVRLSADATQGDLLPAGLHDADRSVAFVIGPPDVCNAPGLGDDPEYGWPQHVSLQKITSIADLMPGHRRHPFFTDGNQPMPIAASVMIGEWRILAAKPSS